MAVSYSLSLRNTRMTDIVTAIGSGGKLEIGTAGMGTILATFSLDSTAGTVAAGVLTFSGMPKNVSALNDGTAAAARIRTAADVDVVTGLTVGTVGTDVIIDSTSITESQSITLTSATITHS